MFVVHVRQQWMPLAFTRAPLLVNKRFSASCLHLRKFSRSVSYRSGWLLPERQAHWNLNSQFHIDFVLTAVLHIF